MKTEKTCPRCHKNPSSNEPLCMVCRFEQAGLGDDYRALVAKFPQKRRRS
jgi:hypothetical protein